MLKYIFALIGFLIASSSFAHEEPVRLDCEYSSIINEDGSRERTAGRHVFLVSFLDEGRVRVVKDGLEAKYFGTAIHSEIYAKADYSLYNGKISEEIVIDRYSGEIRRTRSDKLGTSIFVGKCKTRLF